MITIIIIVGIIVVYITAIWESYPRSPYDVKDLYAINERREKRKKKCREKLKKCIKMR